uniref:Rho guanine nucleotide exchange factor 19 n=1 Tax=Nothobranchius furzeri TaxID=105023 RepID=A0A8C6KZC0_NOTFU
DPPVSNRLSRFLPSCVFAQMGVPLFLNPLDQLFPEGACYYVNILVFTAILYQEYSDVAINREIQRQQGKEPGTEEEGSDGTPSPSNLSPSSSFRSSRGSAFALWQDIPDVRTSGQLDNFSNEERKLQEAKFELVTSEASYIRSLTIAVDHFMLSQELTECLGAQDKQWLFSKLPEVKDVSERFLQELEHRLEEDILRFDVCDIVLDHCPALQRVYLPYVTNQAYQEQTYQRLLQENPRFPGILSRLEEDPICQRLPLTSFLILPFQRITRLKMLVENILKRTTPGSRDEDTATKAFNELKTIIKECNSSVQSMKRMEELIHLNKKINFEGKIFPLISQSRWLVKHGELLEVDTQMMSISGSKLKLPTRPVYLHLFNDCLLLSRRKDAWKFMVFVHAKIGELKVKDLSQKLQGISGFIFHLQLCEVHFKQIPFIHPLFLSAVADTSQVQCIKSYQAQEHDELTLEKADILHAKTITSDGWVEGIRLSDGERGWFPKTYVEEITSRSARLRNLRENIRIKCVTQKLKVDD